MARLTQAQRSRARKNQDKADSIAAAERAGDVCEVCGVYVPYERGGQNHHDYRKSTHPAYRPDRQNHTWCCGTCHRDLHDNVIRGHIMCHEIRQHRGDNLELHPSARR